MHLTYKHRHFWNQVQVHLCANDQISYLSYLIAVFLYQLPYRSGKWVYSVCWLRCGFFSRPHLWNWNSPFAAADVLAFLVDMPSFVDKSPHVSWSNHHSAGFATQFWWLKKKSLCLCVDQTPHPYHSRYASSPTLPASVTAHSSRSCMVMKGDCITIIKNGGKGWFHFENLRFLPRQLGIQRDLTWGEQSKWWFLQVGNWEVNMIYSRTMMSFPGLNQPTSEIHRESFGSHCRWYSAPCCDPTVLTKLNN